MEENKIEVKKQKKKDLIEAMLKENKSVQEIRNEIGASKIYINYIKKKLQL